MSIQNKLANENFPSKPNLTLNELLDEVGFLPWLTITNTFLLPTISMIGVVFCLDCGRKEKFFGILICLNCFFHI